MLIAIEKTRNNVVWLIKNKIKKYCLGSRSITFDIVAHPVSLGCDRVQRQMKPKNYTDEAPNVFDP